MRMKFLRLKCGRVDVDHAAEEGQGLLLLQRLQTCDDGEEHEHHKRSSDENSRRLFIPMPETTHHSLQVVILKASIHCHGCGRRVKKAIEKLEGVDTFHVDVSSQKVTVIGRMRPSAALECVKKVIKSVEFWESPPSPSPAAAAAAKLSATALRLSHD